MEGILSVQNIFKKYGENVLALNDVNLEVNEGDFTCIMGPSGSGKTTLLNMLATIDSPTKGKVILFGENIKSLTDGKLAQLRYENIGFIFQEFNLIDTLTLRENIIIPLTLAGEKGEIIEERLEKIAVQLEIKEFLNKYPLECSGGQKQRAAAARALINDPKIIVADEPTGNLDTKNSHGLLQILKNLNEAENRTIVLVTHDSMIASYSKKLVFLRDGKIDEVLEKGDKTQSEFFYNIVEVTSKENQNLFNVMGKN